MIYKLDLKADDDTEIRSPVRAMLNRFLDDAEVSIGFFFRGSVSYKSLLP